MTTEEFIVQLDKRIASLDEAGLIFGLVGHVHEKMIERIFDDGRKPDGSQIGSYSTKEMWADKQQFKNTGAFQPLGKVRTGTNGSASLTTKAGTAKAKAGYMYTSRSGEAKHKMTTIAVKNTNAGGQSERKTMYFPQGYKELKQVQGYESDFVNLTYSADLRNDLASHLTIQDGAVVSVVTRNINAQKISGLKAKYGDDLFMLSQEEKDLFKEEAGKAVTHFLQTGEILK